MCCSLFNVNCCCRALLLLRLWCIVGCACLVVCCCLISPVMCYCLVLFVRFVICVSLLAVDWLLRVTVVTVCCLSCVVVVRLLVGVYCLTFDVGCVL